MIWLFILMIIVCIALLAIMAEDGEGPAAILVSLCLSLFSICFMTELSVPKTSTKGYNVWCEKTFVGGKCVDSTFHVAPKK